MNYIVARCEASLAMVFVRMIFDRLFSSQSRLICHDFSVELLKTLWILGVYVFLQTLKLKLENGES